MLTSSIPPKPCILVRQLGLLMCTATGGTKKIGLTNIFKIGCFGQAYIHQWNGDDSIIGTGMYYAFMK